MKSLFSLIRQIAQLITSLNVRIAAPSLGWWWWGGAATPTIAPGYKHSRRYSLQLFSMQIVDGDLLDGEATVVAVAAAGKRVGLVA